MRKKLTPRQYQVDAVQAARQALQDTNQALVVMATGLGKTVTAALLWRDYLPGRGLFLVHNNGILEQALQEFRWVFGENKRLALFNGYSKDIEGADIVFATFQTMRQNLGQFPRGRFTWMTVDESHHSQASSWKRVIEHFQCPRLAITATPNRMDQQDIRELFGEEVVNVPLEEAIANEWLPKIEYSVMTDEGFNHEALQELLKQAKTGRRLTLKDVNKKLFVDARDDRVAEIVQEQGGKAIVFCQSIQHAENFVVHLEDAATYHSAKPPEDNYQVLQDLREGKVRRLLAVNAFNEGMDVPDVDLVTFYRTTQSETVFRQQLGRGLRPGKPRLRVLDFVGNVQRALYLKQLAQRITDAAGLEASCGAPRLQLSGQGFHFDFTEEVVELLRVLEEASYREPPYDTYEEAQRAARQLGVRTKREYQQKRTEDPKLPAWPEDRYKGRGWKGYREFLGTTSPPKYPTLSKCQEACRRLRINTPKEYRKRKSEDPRLPAAPDEFYKDKGWSNWPAFFGRSPKQVYETYEEAQDAVQRLGIRTTLEYRARWREDPRLPSRPNVKYAKRWTGFRAFCGRSFYSFEELRTVCENKNIKTSTQYIQAVRVDPKMPMAPNNVYPEWPGYPTFLRSKGRQPPYDTYKEAQTAAQRLGIHNTREYTQRFRQDPRLRSLAQLPDLYPEWEGIAAFLGEQYEMFPGKGPEAQRIEYNGQRKSIGEWAVEAGIPAQALHRRWTRGWTPKSIITTPYRRCRKKHRRKDAYPTWQEASQATIRLGIRTYAEYTEKKDYKKDPKLPASPQKRYEDWPGWAIFLGRKGPRSA